jgi:hypothetical protein
MSALVLVASSAPDHSQGAEISEPYAPFRMVYINHDAVWGPVTLELTWRSSRSWTKVVTATEFPEGVGAFMSYEHGAITRYEPSTGYTTEYTAGDKASCELSARDAGVPAAVATVPEPWLIPRAFATENGWEYLGLDSDGYQQYERVLGVGATEYKEIHRRDPVTGLVMGVSETDPEGTRDIAIVISYEALPLPGSAP